MKISQRTIYFANLNPTKGHEQSGLRPVIVLQNDILNKNLNTVVIAPLTSNLHAKGLLTTYFLDKNYYNLAFDSLILLTQIRTIDKSRLTRKITQIDPDTFREIKKQLTLIF
jgi:mRNA interferase MazF